MTEYVAASLFGAKGRGEPPEAAKAGWACCWQPSVLRVMPLCSGAADRRDRGSCSRWARSQGHHAAGNPARLHSAAAGLIVGSLAAAALARVLWRLCWWGGSALIRWMYAAATGFTVFVTLASAAIPAWRALRGRPAVALRLAVELVGNGLLCRPLGLSGLIPLCRWVFSWFPGLRLGNPERGFLDIIKGALWCRF